ncbi:MAG: hypothetical protein ACRDJ5_06305, partial [Actinomycetota bacterium]
IWSKQSPLQRGRLLDRPDENDILEDFAIKAITSQPLDYAASIGSDLTRYASPDAPEHDINERLWRFPRTLADVRPLPQVSDRYNASPPSDLGFTQELVISRGLSGFLHEYQGLIYTWGPLAAILTFLGLIAPLFRPPGQRLRDLGAAGVLLSLSALGLILFRLAVGTYGFRYVIVALPFIGAAGAVGLHALLTRNGRGRSWRRWLPGRSGRTA